MMSRVLAHIDVHAAANTLTYTSTHIKYIKFQIRYQISIVISLYLVGKYFLCIRHNVNILFIYLSYRLVRMRG